MNAKSLYVAPSQFAAPSPANIRHSSSANAQRGIVTRARAREVRCGALYALANDGRIRHMQNGKRGKAFMPAGRSLFDHPLFRKLAREYAHAKRRHCRKDQSCPSRRVAHCVSCNGCDSPR
jgi:hypothetical protein